MRAVTVRIGSGAQMETQFHAGVCDCGRCGNFVMTQVKPIDADMGVCEMIVLPLADIPALIDDLMKLSLRGEKPS